MAQQSAAGKKSAGGKKGGAMKALMAKQYEGTDETSLDDYLKNKKKVTLLPGQTCTGIAPVETSKFMQRLSQCEGKGSKQQNLQKKHLRRVASAYFNDFDWTSGHMVISDAVADLVAVGAVPEPWRKADGTLVPIDNFPGFRRIGKIAKQDAADDWNDKQHNTKVRKLERRERNPAPGKKEASNTQGATLKWGEDSLVVANAAKEGVEVPRRSEEGERRRLLYTGRGPRGDRRQPRRAENVICDSCTRNVADGAGKVYSPHNHTTHILLAGGQLVCKICDTSGRVIMDDLVEAGVKEEEMPVGGQVWLYALKRRRLCDDDEAKDIFDEAIAASYAATVDCKEVTDRQQRLAEPAWAEQDPSQRAASRRRRAMRGVFAGDDDVEDSASSSDDDAERGAVSASPPPPRRPSGPPPLTSPVSEGSAGSGGSRSRASAASRAGSARSGHSARSASGAGRGSSRRRRRIRTVLRSPRSPSESPAKRRRLANDAARDYVEDNFGVFLDFQAALRELCGGEHSGSFLADDAGALDDLLDAFLEKARRS